MDPGGAVSPDFLDVFSNMQETAPDMILDLENAASPTDGRRRRFSWTVPRDNGHAITKYVLRREGGGAAPAHASHRESAN